MTYLKKPFGHFLLRTHGMAGKMAPMRKKNTRAGHKAREIVRIENTKSMEYLDRLNVRLIGEDDQMAFRIA